MKRFKFFIIKPYFQNLGEEKPNKIITEVYLYLKSIDVINACSSRRIDRLKREVTNDLNSNVILHNRLKELIKFADTGIVGLDIEEANLSDIGFPDDIPQRN